MNELFKINNLSLYVSKEHRFGSDAMKLADFAAAGVHNGNTVCDLCTGCGIIPIALMSKDVKPAKIYALDINEEAFGLLKKTIKYNLLEDIIIPIHEDLKNITKIFAGSVDLVTVNPPYFKENDGFKRENTAAARHELLCNLDDVVKAGASLLKYGGILKMCHLPERLADVIATLRKYNLEPKKLEFVMNEEGGKRDEPWLLLVSAKKGGKPALKVKIT